MLLDAMLRIFLFIAASLLFAPAGGAAEIGGDAALYRAQRYAYSGYLHEALAEMRASRGARPACPVVVKLRARGVDVPLCAPPAVQAPSALRSRVDILLRRSAAASPATAARLLEEARRLDPFDARLVSPLARALRALGREADARRVEAEAAALRRGRTVLRAGMLWAGSR